MNDFEQNAWYRCIDTVNVFGESIKDSAAWIVVEETHFGATDATEEHVM